jgi:hypothetical protein
MDRWGTRKVYGFNGSKLELIGWKMIRRSFRAEREFGLIVGGILSLLSMWWLYRGKFETATHVLLPVGSLLVVVAILWPRALVLPNRAWMGLAEILSYVSTRIILALVYFFIITPIGVIKRAMGWDPLRRRTSAASSYWSVYPERNSTHYEKMY